MTKQPPLYKDGELICPHCHFPLLMVENRKGEFQCFLCRKKVGRLSEEVMKKMLDDFPGEVLREWEIEMEAVS